MKLNSATVPNNLQRENEVVILLMCEMYPHRLWEAISRMATVRLSSSGSGESWLLKHSHWPGPSRTRLSAPRAIMFLRAALCTSSCSVYVSVTVFCGQAAHLPAQAKAPTCQEAPAVVPSQNDFSSIFNAFFDYEIQYFLRPRKTSKIQAGRGTPNPPCFQHSKVDENH